MAFEAPHRIRHDVNSDRRAPITLRMSFTPAVEIAAVPLEPQLGYNLVNRDFPANELCIRQQAS
jgi:hypothetical protein